MFEKLLGNVKGIFNIVTIIELVVSIVCILLGLVFFTNSTLSNIIVSVLTGILLIGNGISSIYAYFKRGSIVLFNNNLIYGIIFIIVGIISLFLGKVLSILLGIYLIIVGVQKINYGILLKKFHESSWLIILVTGVLLLVIAVITFFTSGDAVIKVTGIALLGYGILNIINNVLLRRRSIYFIS